MKDSPSAPEKPDNTLYSFTTNLIIYYENPIIGSEMSRAPDQPIRARDTSMDRREFLHYTGLAAVLGTAGCVSTGGNGGSSDPDEVVIGSNHPLSGPTAYTGSRMDDAVRLAAMLKNESGGIESMGGADVAVVTEDNKGKQELGSEAARALVDDGADVLTGCFSSPVTDDATRVAESEGVPFVISSAADADILQETSLEYVYRPQPSSDRMSENHAAYLLDIAGDHGIDVETAALFYLDNSYGQSIRDGLREALPRAGIDIVEEAAIAFGATPETQVTKFREADPDTVIATTFESQTVDLVQAMDDQGYRPPLLSGVANAAFTNLAALEEMGDTAEGALATGYSIDVISEEAQAVQQRYEAEFDEPLDPANPGMAFGATQVIIEALERAGTTDRETVNETLEEAEFADHILAMPPVQFDESGENENAMAVLHQVQGRSSSVVYPEAYAETAPHLEL